MTARLSFLSATVADRRYETMFKRQHYIALVITAATILAILNLPSRTTARLKLAIGSLFLPIFGLASSTHQLAEKTSDAITSRGELIRQNETLRTENQQLRMQALQAEESTRENARLRQLIGWQQQKKWNLKLARVVLRDPANWWRTVQIDCGSRDGMRTNLTVLTTEGLVGRISSVTFDRSQVVLVGDPNCKVSAQIENDNGDMGVIGSSGPFDGSLVELSYLSRNANLKPGQNVISSGLGGIFPKGIPIGKIVDSRAVEYGLYVEARVKLAADLSALDEVWVLFP
ncbi:MAG TPA: rod shape-determining protein MreC [Candidatus Paceibacterota bacterium]|nr:rod shape-determining protein MreC [Candidatus Paceibacterota bacterium]